MTTAAPISNGTHSRPGLLRRLWSSPWPAIGCEISAAGVSAARWSWSTARLETVAWKPLPAGVIEASPLRENIREPEPVREALRAALASIGVSNGTAARHFQDAVLVIPDQAARLFVFTLDTLPKRSSDAFSLVQFRLKKSVPFDIETAAVSYQAERRGNRWEVVAIASPQAVVHQYERLLEALGLRPRCVVLSTLATLGLVPESQSGPRDFGSAPGGSPGILVAKYSAPWFTTAILQANQVRLFRTVGLPQGPDGLPAPEAVVEALYPSMVFFQDNFSDKLERAWLCGLGASHQQVADLLASELRVDPLAVADDASLGAVASDPLHQELYFSALLGVVQEHSRA